MSPRTECIKGHKFTPENTREETRVEKNGLLRRRCRTCDREQARARRVQPPEFRAPHPDWMDDAVCAIEGVPVDYFFPVSAGAYPSAVQLMRATYCNRCPVIETCLQAAIAYNAEGVWAGTGPRERANIKRRMTRKAG